MSSSSPGAPARTVVHLLRHGEVENPGGILYGRLPDFHLSQLGRDMAVLAADYLAPRDLTHLVSSPLERAQETAAPLAERTGLAVTLDARALEAINYFEGQPVAGGKGLLRRPSMYRYFVNPRRPSWGEPYVEIVERMNAAIADARDAARGHEAVIVSHQAPIWMARLAAEGRSLAHNPGKRQCSLASVTSLAFDGDELASITYAEPAAALLPLARKGAGA